MRFKFTIPFVYHPYFLAKAGFPLYTFIRQLKQTAIKIYANKITMYDLLPNVYCCPIIFHLHIARCHIRSVNCAVGSMIFPLASTRSHVWTVIFAVGRWLLPCSYLSICTNEIVFPCRKRDLHYLEIEKQERECNSYTPFISYCGVEMNFSSQHIILYCRK